MVGTSLVGTWDMRVEDLVGDSKDVLSLSSLTGELVGDGKDVLLLSSLTDELVGNDKDVLLLSSLTGELDEPPGSESELVVTSPNLRYDSSRILCTCVMDGRLLGS